MGLALAPKDFIAKIVYAISALMIVKFVAVRIPVFNVLKDILILMERVL